MTVMKEFKKYGFRFGLLLAIALPLLYFTQGENAVKIIAYKVAMVSVGLGLAETWWMVAFKPQFGRTEAMLADKQQAILMFRGVLYAAIVLACTLGL
jgi:hypothetical protein